MADASMPSYGIAQGLADGLKSGLIGYQNMQNIQHQNQMQELMTGVRKNPDTGALEYTPEKQQQIKAQGLLAQRATDELSPDSDASKNLAIARGGLVHAGNPKIDPNVFNGMSAADQKDLEGLAKPDIASYGGLMKNLAGPRQEQADTAKDNQTSQAVDKVTNDSQLKAHTQRIQGANRILSQLSDVKSGKIVDTHQLLNDVNTEYVALLTGSNNPALGKQERTEYTSKAGQLAGLIQDITAHPESVNSPDIMNQLETQVRGLKTNYQGQVSARAKLLQRGYKHNPEATQAQKEKIAEITGEFGDSDQQPAQGLLGAQPPPATAPHPQDSAAVQWAKANPNDPRAAAIMKANGL